MTALDLAPIEAHLDAAYDDGSWTDPDLGAFLNDVGALLAEVKALRAQVVRVRAVVAESSRITLTISSNRDILDALDGSEDVS